MTTEELSRALVGNVGAVVSPLVEDSYELDTKGLQGLVAAQEAAGATAVSVLGTTGEGHLLAPSIADAVLEATVRAASVPVVAGVTGTTTQDVLRMCRWAHEHGASAVLVTPPTYYRLGAATVEAFFSSVIDGSPVPVLVDHMPGLAKVTIALPALARLGGHPNVAAIVDGSEDIAATADLIRAVPADTPVLIARAPLLLAGLALGAAGLLSPAGGCAPEVVASLLRAWSAGDVTGARQAQAELSALSVVLHTTRVPVSHNVKVLLAHVGALAAAVSPAPFGDLSAAERADLVSKAVALDALRSITRHAGTEKRDDCYADSARRDA